MDDELDDVFDEELIELTLLEELESTGEELAELVALEVADVEPLDKLLLLEVELTPLHAETNRQSVTKKPYRL